MTHEKEQLTYTTIIHQIRKKLELSLMEYCISDSIYHLSNNPKSKIIGWCWASKKTLAEVLGTTEQTVFENINKLIQKNIVERDSDTHYLRTTNRWYENVILIKASAEYQEALYPKNNGVYTVSRNLIHDHKITLHNNNTDNDNYKKIITDLKKWNENQSSPIQNFEPENIVKKHGIEKVEIMVKQYGRLNGGFFQFLKALKK